MKPARTCANCIKSRPISFTNDVLCKNKGVISANFVCIRHKFIPNFRSFKEMDYKCIDCTNFIISKKNLHHNQSIGLCRLFSVRNFDGNKKKACSKFIMNHEFKSAVLNNIN
jgi:hypothetical protein